MTGENLNVLRTRPHVFIGLAYLGGDLIKINKPTSPEYCREQHQLGDAPVARPNAIFIQFDKQSAFGCESVDIL